MTPTHTEKCRSCAHEGPHPVTVMNEGKHYARVDCGECSRFMRWLPKPEDDATKYKRPKGHLDLVRKFGRGFCEMCCIREEQLPKGESLEGHHVVEFQNGGEASKENTWILCTACHSLVNWRRTYVKHLLASLVDKMTEWRQS